VAGKQPAKRYERKTDTTRRTPIPTGGTQTERTRTREHAGGRERRHEVTRRTGTPARGTQTEHVLEIEHEPGQAPRAVRARQAARTVATAPSTVAKAVTGKASRGDAALLSTALLAGFALVGIRAVADFSTTTVSTDSGDTSVTKGKVLHPAGQYGPIPILAGLIMGFFLLSAVAAGGGTKAKVAGIFGWLLVLVLGLNSIEEIGKVSSTIGAIGSIAAGSTAGSESSGASGTNTSTSGGSGSPGGTNTSTNPATPSGWQAVPDTNGLEVYPVKGKCPSGWRLVGDRCISPADVVTGPPET
jgi:hypothetical protein